MTPFARSWFARILATRLLLVAASSIPFVAPLRAADRLAVEAAIGSIRASELRKHVEVLADDAFEGREAGSRGGRAAGGYLAERFQKAGLVGRGNDGGMFQDFGNGSRNLLGFLEGSDPQLQSQVVVIGAHYDHVGYGSRRTSLGPIGYIHNGADDNASGTACLVEMVNAFKTLGVAPRRSILFALWDGEEHGLLGSKHWVAHPTIPLDRLVCCLNSDMVGRLRNNRVEILGSRTARGLRQLTARANVESTLEIDFKWELKPDSDHHSFFARQIPVLMLHTGLHDDYHRPSDDVEKVNAEGMEQLARFWFQIALGLADADQVAGFRAQSLHETPATRKQLEASLAAPPPRIGVSFRKHADLPGLELTAVDRYAPGGQAGLKVGDRMIRIGDAPIDDENRFRLLVLAAQAPIKFSVQRAGADQPVEVNVALAGAPTRVGLWWREDDAEPGSILVSLIVPGSAAAQAGVQLGDRVYSIGGQPFANGTQFRERLTTLPAPIPLEIERRGQWRTITLEPLPPIE